MNVTIRPRRLFVSGGSRLSRNAALLWQELGRLLATEKGLIVITGGFDHYRDAPSSRTADRMIIDGMLRALDESGIPPETRVETFLPDSANDWSNLVRFKEGRVRIFRNRNAQSRRFSMVYSADVIVSIEGSRGTRSVLDAGLAIERPILPIPFGGGASRDVWNDHRDFIVQWFRLDEADARHFEGIRLEELTEPEIFPLAQKVYACLMNGFTQGCFVIMRFHEDSDPVFDEAISPALKSQGFQPWRTDRSVPAGDVMAAIRDGIDHCYFAVADTTGDRPNVMYELGLAHASKKPVILLRRANPDGSVPPTPFDFQNQSILKYLDDGLDDLRRRLEAAIGVMSGKLDDLNVDSDQR